ncbi:hypothetical protein [Methylorubrum extorquens]|nr:hypothetical protein [Methylorubrum extorquens]MCP1539004.1 hypothetical protein [Methylorubrum extorquens]
MSTKPTIPNAASLVLSREWFAFFSALLAYTAEIGARLAKLKA